jgi:hypothetical protein
MTSNLQLDLEKHRDEQEIFSVSFAANLGAGETLSSPELKIAQRSLSGWTDKTTEFVPTAISVFGDDQVQFTLAKRTDAAQAAGRYTIWCKADTSGGRILVETPTLRVKDEASL